jgi:two-component system, HptB-dependent secretion and biofilm response regulator
MNNSICVLIVDDDLINRLVLCALLKEDGYKTLEADNGEAAVAAVRDNDIDIILLDIMMPVMDGYEAAKIIKKTNTKFIPIIFLTAVTDDLALAKCLEAGGDDFLVKPYHHIVLRAKISSMLRIAGLYKEVEAQNIELNEHHLRVQQEIDVSKSVFSRMLSGASTAIYPGLRYSMSPMSIFNGDMIMSDKNKSGGIDIMISDFTGHGLSAAIGSIPVSDIFSAMTRKGFAFSEILSECNNKLKKMLPTQMFMAAAYICVDRTNHVVTVVNCGLPELYLVRQSKIIKAFSSMNLPLGIINQQAEDYGYEMETLQVGDRIIAMTDGVLEAQNKSGELFGKDRLLSILTAAESADNVFDIILRDCKLFTSDVTQSDDITLLEFFYNENVDIAEQEEISKALKPAEWSMRFSLDMQSLRNFDILPYIMQGINGLQSIPNGRSVVHTVLTEIYANALDHGLLKLDSSIKSSPDGYMAFYQQKQTRLETINEGNIQIELSHELKPGGGGKLVIHVVDSGEGFDFKNRNTDLSQIKGYSGRGMGLISKLCKEVKFLGKGNVIMVLYEWD